MSKFEFYRIGRLLFVAFILAAGCTSRGPSVAIGECIAPVDGMKTWKVTRVEGSTLYVQTVGEGAPIDAVEETLPKTVHYAKINCP